MLAFFHATASHAANTPFSRTSRTYLWHSRLRRSVVRASHFRSAKKALPHRRKGFSAPRKVLFRTSEDTVSRHRKARSAPFRRFSHPPLHTFNYGKARSASSGTPPPDSRHSISEFPAVKIFYFHTAYLFISPRRPTLPATAIRQPPSPRLTAVTQPAGCTAVKRHASHRHLTTYPDVYTPTLLTTVRQFITFASHSGKIPCGGHSFTQDNAAGRNDGIPSYRLTRLVLRKETVMRRRPHTRCSTRRAPSHSRHGSRTPRPGTLKV